ncbi:MAG: hypothetical protein GY853_16875 [PVC group bacterium]|nr:hypothetical protein [PVC group bacterium]
MIKGTKEKQERLTFIRDTILEYKTGNNIKSGVNMGQNVTREEWPEIPSNMGEIVTTTTNPHNPTGNEQV